ncbi:hypothetical protein HYG86_05190 [Alkalicella caledoniensis]|uniref:Uncharacterized protein n=1 Tax=Alkalicella caledoniensis TaxID=2731377 RepID=A0A7G9W696_ALKCA|nr:hypothetical protein [Alkalicella caledoniensis]QNO14208.1 hypothetical protein HYG86_05190 [Alkalicella caledoniensis]
MRKEDIKKSFDGIEPNSISTQRMLNKVLNHADKKQKKSFISTMNLKKIIPAAAMICVLTVGVLNYDLFLNKPSSGAETDRLTGDDFAREDMADIMRDQFKIEDRTYMLLTQWHKEQFNLPNTIKESDIGENITTITSSIDESLIGLDIYGYIPAGGEAIVAVKRDGVYELFMFLNFDSYINNKDEDVATYLKLYGINSPADISKIQFIGYSEEAKLRGVPSTKGEISDTDGITTFYNFYSVMKDASDKYFDKLYNYRIDQTKTKPRTPSEPRQLPPDYGKPQDEAPDSSVSTDHEEAVNTLPIGTDEAKPPVDLGPSKDARDSQGRIIDKGDDSQANGEDRGQSKGEQGQSTEPSVGNVGDALFNSVSIRIYNQKGIYFEAQYYPNLGFISRHEVSAEFAAFLDRFVN